VVYAYTSNGTAVATVSDAGLVTAIAPGTATITVTATGSGTGFATTVLVQSVPVTVQPIVLGLGFGVEQFAAVEPGTFQMGAPSGGESNERPVHAVTLTSGFLMQKTEVTQAQWRLVMAGTGNENPSAFSSCAETCPVETVSWSDVQVFLQRLNQQDPGKNYRLPTEAEWEYAARAGTTGEYGGTGNLNDMGWYSANSGGRPRPVAQKLANAWGLFDMHGNVAEWVNDRYALYGMSPVVDPIGPTTGAFRIIRGGDWANGAFASRSTGRSFFTPSARGDLSGFRVVRTPPAP
jgi:formylglycine-generating enzyme required for sulfatase activity